MQTTLANKVSVEGIGLHTGLPVTMTLVPSFTGRGIVFRRTDIGNIEVPAAPRFVDSVHYATRLSRHGASVETVEHVLAALHACEIDNAVVEVSGPEVPSVDGSSRPFVEMILRAGSRELSIPRHILRIVKKFSVMDGDKSIHAYPDSDFNVTYSIEFNHPLLTFQKHTLPINRCTFASDIAPARTFGFYRDVEALRKRGLARGGSLENAVVIGDDRVLNKELRFDNEFVRHKILDLVGDLALAGHQIRGHVVVHKGGHQLHTEFLKKMLARRDVYELVPDMVRTPRFHEAFAPAHAAVASV